MNRIILTGLVIIGSLIALVYLAVYLLLPKADQAVTPIADPTVMPTPQIAYILVAARDVRRGAQIEASDVTIMGWPLTNEITPPLGALLADAPNDQPARDQVIGRIARTDILKNQPMLDFMLTPLYPPQSLINVPPTSTP